MSGFGFLSPLLFGLAGLSIPIFLLYMLRLRRTEVSISSTFLWQQLVRDREANAPWQRLRPSWLLLLQLLILAALVLALARPFTEVKTIITGRTVLLLDASASMNANDEGGKTRFEAAQSLALETVDTLGPDDTMTIIRVAEIPEVLVAASRDKSILKRAIRDADSSSASADWQAAFTLAAAGGRGVDTLRVVALSDGGIPNNLPEIPGTFTYVKIGEEADNVAITALSTRALPNDAPQLFAQITNFGDEETSVIFAVELDGNLQTANRYTIPAGRTNDVIIEDLPTNFQMLKATISSPSNSNTPDYLEADNVAYAVFNQSSGGNVLVMADQNIFLERVFSSLPGATLTLRTPAEGLPTRDFDLYVFDSWLPNSLPNADLLLINPPASTNLFDVTGQSTNTAINPDTGGVNPEDSRTRFLDFSPVNIRTFKTLDRTGDWATALVQTANGEPLVLAGEIEGRQVAIITFDLHDSDLGLQISWPILVSSLMQWYQPQRAISIVDSIPPGTPITVHPTIEATKVQIKAPNGDKTTSELTESATVIYGDTEQLGLYEIEIFNGDRVVQQDVFAVNLFDARESNIKPVDEITIATSEGTAVVGSSQGEEIGRREWWQYLAYAGLLLLGIEWWYYHRLRNRVKPVANRVSYGTKRKKSAPRWQFWARHAR